MGWKKHFKVYQPGENSQSGSPLGNNSSTSKFQSWLPEVYTGMPNRVERYMQYDQMDMDSEINMALDTIAEFSTQIDEETASPFKVVFKDDPTDSESQVIQQTLRQWCNINEWDRRIFKTFRNVVKYGDQPFIRDPDTWELMYVNPQDVTGAVINESEGKDIVQYVIRNVDLNIGNKTATTPIGIDRTTGGFQGGQFSTPTNRTVNTQYGGHLNATPNQELSIDAKDVVHIALTEGMDANWPFGNSILDPLFKTYKQKELLEDAIIIYRVQRAPERRVFYIDVGEMPPHKAGAFLEKIKMEVHQKRIPNKSGGGSNVLDAQYNPMSMLEDYFFAQNSDGRGSKVETLPGGDGLGEIGDLTFFTDKLMRALRIPSSYMPMTQGDAGASYSDGRVGSAFIQEFRFNVYCQRLQNSMQPTLDREFKLFMKNKGLTIDASSFDIRFTEPQSFSDYRQIELDGSRASLFNQMEGSAYLSKRFILQKYLGLSKEEILENERMYLEENPLSTGGAESNSDQDIGLSDVGIKSGDFDMGDDDFDMGEMEDGTDNMSADVSPLGGVNTDNTGDDEI